MTRGGRFRSDDINTLWSPETALEVPFTTPPSSPDTSMCDTCTGGVSCRSTLGSWLGVVGRGRRTGKGRGRSRLRRDLGREEVVRTQTDRDLHRYTDEEVGGGRERRRTISLLLLLLLVSRTLRLNDDKVLGRRTQRGQE